MYTFINSKLQSIQNASVILEPISEITQKYGKITLIAIGIFSAGIGIAYCLYRHWKKVKQLAPNKSNAPIISNNVVPDNKPIHPTPVPSDSESEETDLDNKDTKNLSLQSNSSKLDKTSESNIQPSQSHIESLPSEMYQKLFAYLTIADIVHWKNANHSFNTKIEIDKIIQDREVSFTQAVATLTSFPTYRIGAQLVYKSPNEIQQMGGIILTPNQSTEYVDRYGIVLLKEYLNDKTTEKWFLHICPGGGNLDFDQQTINDLMPIAIKKLCELNIKPDYLSREIGRHSGDTLENFENWQKQALTTQNG